jgi:hypothetical protein
MNNEDWTQGVENEARSVSDPAWAAEARRVAGRRRFWTMARPLLLTLVLTELLILLWNAVTVQQTLSITQSRPWVTSEAAWWALSLSLMLVSTLCLGVVLGFNRIKPRLAIPVVIAFPIFQVITGLVVPPPGRPFPNSTLEAADLYPRLDWGEAAGLLVSPWGWAQFFIITVGIWVGIRLGAHWRAQPPRVHL